MIPASMLIFTGFPAIFSHNWTNFIPSSLVTTGSMTYLTYNTKNMLSDDKLGLKPNEYAFAVSQTYLNFDLYQAAQKIFKHNHDYRNTYESI